MTIYNTMLEPWDIRTDPHPGRLFFVCPHCQAEVEQTPENFHYWCSACGRNATDPAEPVQKGLPSAEWAGQAAKAEGVWHRIYLRGSETHQMRCGFRVPATDAEIADGLDSFARIDSYCPTCFYTPNP